MVRDLLLAAWLLATVLTVLLGVRAWLARTALGSSWIAAYGVAAVLAIGAVRVLAIAHLVNWFTLLAVFLAGPAYLALSRHGWHTERALRLAVRRIAIAAAHHVEQTPAAAAARQRAVAWLRGIARGLPSLPDPPRTVAGLTMVVVAAAAVTVTVAVRLGPVAGDVRLGSPDAYALVLDARQAIHGGTPGHAPGPAPALVAAVSLASAIDPVHVARLMAPCIGIAIVLATAWLARRAGGSPASALVVLWVLGAYTWGLGGAGGGGFLAAALQQAFAAQWVPNGTAIGVLSMLLAAGAWPEHDRAWRRHAATILPCAVVIAVSAPTLLIALAVRLLVPHAPRPLRFPLLAASWTGAALAGAWLGNPAAIALLPAALALAAGAAWSAAASYGARVRMLGAQPAALALLMLLTVSWMPANAGGLYLEHRQTAREAMELAATLPRGKWLMVAPIEQLAAVYGRGWFEEPAAFVSKYSARAGDPAFVLDVDVDNVFVFVERRPFQTFASEAATLPFAVFTDPSYRHYRSLAGRASLQWQLYRLCEAYRRSHAGASIHFEDDTITIYKFAREH